MGRLFPEQRDVRADAETALAALGDMQQRLLRSGKPQQEIIDGLFTLAENRQLWLKVLSDNGWTTDQPSTPRAQEQAS